MNTYEDNQEYTPQEEQTPEAAEYTPEPQEEVTTAYHAEGVGQRETVAAQDPYSFHGYGGQGVYQQPAQQSASLPKPRKKHTALKRVIAAVLVVALVAGACGITAAVLNHKWEAYMESEMAYMQEKINALRKDLDSDSVNLGGELIISPTEGLTPAQVYQQNLQSVVAITCQIVSYGFGNQSSIQTSSGSGFVLTADGYVVTNYHVIDGATAITVVTAEDAEYTAELIGGDESNDIALLKVEATDLRPVTIGSSDELAVGSQVVAIGNALGELNASLTVGYISGKDRSISTDGTIINMLQTDAAINSGNSGGPLFNMHGEVIGITSAKYSGETSSGASIEGIGFAIPIDDVIGMLEDLRTYGYITGVQMGVMVTNMDASVADKYGFPVGVYVDSVVDGSCAQAAGIRAKDIILDVGGYEITTLNDLTRALRKFKAGDSAIVSVWRGGQEVRLTIVFEAKSQD